MVPVRKRSPKKRLLLPHHQIPLPKRRPPRHQLPKLLILLPRQRQFGPPAEQSPLPHRCFHNRLRALRSFGAPHFHSQRQRRTRTRIPLHIKSHPRPLRRMIPQFGLIRIPVIQTRRQTLPPFLVQIERQHLLDLHRRPPTHARRPQGQHRDENYRNSYHERSLAVTASLTRLTSFTHHSSRATHHALRPGCSFPRYTVPFPRCRNGISRLWIPSCGGVLKS
jgi:hypothetical protein